MSTNNSLTGMIKQAAEEFAADRPNAPLTMRERLLVKASLIKGASLAVQHMKSRAIEGNQAEAKELAKLLGKEMGFYDAAD